MRRGGGRQSHAPALAGLSLHEATPWQVVGVCVCVGGGGGTPWQVDQTPTDWCAYQALGGGGGFPLVIMPPLSHHAPPPSHHAPPP